MINQVSVLQRIVEHENIHPQFRAALRLNPDGTEIFPDGATTIQCPHGTFDPKCQACEIEADRVQEDFLAETDAAQRALNLRRELDRIILAGYERARKAVA